MKFSIIFIVDYGKLEWQSICLAASIRAFVRDRDFEIIAYCPADRVDGLEDITKTWLTKFGVDIRPLDTSSQYAPAYPHGNKILACAQPRQSRYCLFMDTDMIFVRPTNLGPLFSERGFCAARETNARWADALELWDRLYEANAPDAPRDLAVFSNQRVAPSYYNAGFFGFDDNPISRAGNRRFGEIWRDISYQIDADPQITEKRPFLDQISLPVAVGASAFTPTELSADYNTHIRFESGAGDGVRVLHYHSNMHGHLLRESRYIGILNQVLHHYGVSENFDALVKAFLPVLDYIGVGMVLEIPTPEGLRIAQVVSRHSDRQILAIFEGVFSERPDDFTGVLAARASFGIVDLPPNLYAKKCRIIGHGNVSQLPWFWYDQPDENGKPERWVWNTRNSWRAANREDIDMSRVTERKLEELAEVLARS
jgi:hypothetical protein